MNASARETPDVPALRRAAMDYLARREHSFHELQHKLLKSFPDSDTVTIVGVINRLRDENLQSDDRFAESYVRYRRSRGFGPRHIEQDLRLRRTLEQSIRSQLQCDETTWYTAAREQLSKKLRLIEKRFSSNRSDSGIKLDTPTRLKLSRQLQGRGFTRDQIDYAFKELT